MIAVVTKSDSKSASPLSLSTPNETKDSKGGLSFGELLHGAKDKESVVLKKGALVLALDTDNKDTKTGKSDALASLLKNEPVELNPAAFKDLSPKELKSLIKDAKDYLKDQITKTDGYKNAQIKEMPQTIKGLVKLAKQYGVDISKITLEKVQVHKSDKLISTDASKVIESTQSDDKVETKPKKNNTDVDADAAEVKTNTKKTNTKDTQLKTQTQNTDVDVQEQSSKVKNEIKSSQVVTTIKESVKETPLFKAQATQTVTTEQTLQARDFKVPEPRTAKERADDTLKLLLRGEKVPNKDGGVKLTTDFSVATARVIAPSATTEAQKSLESLLRGDSSESSTSKLDGFNAPKADSFEVKINEAKQMAKYLSHDVKQAIDNYKAPFTRIKVQLNPQQLGEVDLTVIQRGKNLHVNITSNNAAINALAMNANDLRAQLTNNGIQNATLNFNSGSSDGSQANSQGQDHRQNQQASREYSYFESEEQNEEVLSSLEIVVPNYA